jgi:outer membrane protein W
MKLISRITLLGLPLLTGSLNIFAADAATATSTSPVVDTAPASQLYIDANVGGSWLTDTKIAGDEVSFDLGVRFDFAVGYYINDTLALEFESGWIRNSVDTIGGASLPGNTDLTLHQVPLLVNAVYHVQSDSPWRPYIGIGLGGVVSLFDIDAPSNDQTGSDFTFAYQGKAGLGFALTEQCIIDLSYKMFGALAPEWEFDNGGTIKSDDKILVHCFLASFTYRF